MIRGLGLLLLLASVVGVVYFFFTASLQTMAHIWMFIEYGIPAIILVVVLGVFLVESWS